MPFVNISLARGKSGEYLEAVSRAVHDALVAELHMKPEDDFQLIRQHEAGEMVFNRNFRGGPRSDDWIVFTITDGLDRGERAKRRFYKTLVRLLGEGPADYLVAQLTNTAVLKATGKTVVFQNAWLFEAASGRLVSAQLYADTAAVGSSAG
jgi:hypothetical protein